MSRRADVLVAQTTGLLQFTGGGTQYIVETPTGVIYVVYVDTGSDLAFKKSSDGGFTWSASTVILTGTIVSFAVWYDRWSGISAGLIHLAYTDGADSDTKYRTIDTESSDALSTQTVIFAGASSAAGGHLSIARARGGNVYCKTVIDAGAEGGFFRLPNANVPNGAWDAARTVDETIATQDKMILLPGLEAADNQDMLAIFWDNSANQVSRKIYDDSANSWAEDIMSGTMTGQNAATAWPHFSATLDLAGQIAHVVAWNGIDAANADLRYWTVSESTNSEGTEIVLNGTDDQGLCGIMYFIDLGVVQVVYGGQSDGSETFLTSINLYTKGREGGSTEYPLTTVPALIRHLAVCPLPYTRKVIALYHKDLALDELYMNVGRVAPRATALVVG